MAPCKGAPHSTELCRIAKPGPSRSNRGPGNACFGALGRPRGWILFTKLRCKLNSDNALDGLRLPPSAVPSQECQNADRRAFGAIPRMVGFGIRRAHPLSR